ncbi:MAG: FlgD immunoglobulin-like domain containing protein [Planctomycetaceae bacterium]
MFDAFLAASGAPQLQVTIPPNAKLLTIRIWDRFGGEVRTLLNEPQPTSGCRTLAWDRADDQGQSLSCGYYICRVTVDERSESRVALIL